MNLLTSEEIAEMRAMGPRGMFRRVVATLEALECRVAELEGDVRELSAILQTLENVHADDLAGAGHLAIDARIAYAYWLGKRRPEGEDGKA